MKNMIDQSNYDYGQIVGVDEAGRGPLAGPVVVAAVILPDRNAISGIDDSKKLSEKKRNYLFSMIKEKAVAYHISIVQVEMIDQINILQATLHGMTDAVEKIVAPYQGIWIDGNQAPASIAKKSRTVINGDALEPCIGAASILAKVTRDRLMCDYNEIFPLYGFSKHKGYGTSQHLEALRLYGPCDIHRRSFAPVRKCSVPSYV